MQGGDHALGKVPVPLGTNAGAVEGTVGGLLVDAAFQRGEDGDAHGDQPAAQAAEGTVVLLLGLPDFAGKFQHGGFVEAWGSGQGGAVALGEFSLHAVEGFDVGELKPYGFRACIAHRQEGKAVTIDNEHRAIFGLFIKIGGQLKIESAKCFRRVIYKLIDISNDIAVTLTEKLGHIKGGSCGASSVDGYCRDGRREKKGL